VSSSASSAVTTATALGAEARLVVVDESVDMGETHSTEHVI